MCPEINHAITFLTSEETKNFKDGWDSFEKKQYDLTIFYLKKVDENNYPDINAPLGFSYLEKRDYKNAILNLSAAYNEKVGLNEGYFNKVTNSLGICYMETTLYDRAKIYFEESKEDGNSYAAKNLILVDSLIRIDNVR